MSRGWRNDRAGYCGSFVQGVAHFVRAATLALAAGCGAELEDGGGIAVPQFPEPYEVERIKAQPLPPEAEMFRTAGVDVPQWQLAGPMPTRTSTDAYPGDDVASRVLAAHIEQYGREARMTLGMACVAREVGRVVLAYGQAPSTRLYDFILARCGAGVGTVALSTWQTTGSPLDPAAAEARIDQALARPPAGVIASPGLVLGGWYGESDGQRLLVLVHGWERLGLAPVPMDARGRQFVTVQGTKPSGVESVTALITHGESGFADCRSVGGEGRKFTLRCPVLASDSAAWIDVIENGRRRALRTKTLTLFVSPDGTMPEVYVEPVITTTAIGDSTTAQRIGDAINDLRNQHGLPLVSLEVRQSEEVAELLPHFMAAIHDESRAELADTIILAIIAGTHVETLIQNAQCLHFTTTLAANEGLDRAVARASMFPLARSILLDPEARGVAIGVRANQAGSLAAVMLSTYDPPRQEAYPSLEASLHEQLDLARIERGLPLALRMEDPRSHALLDSAIGRLELGGSPGVLMDRTVDGLAAIYNAQAVGYVVVGIESGRAPSVTWPDALLSVDQIGVLIRVGHYVLPGTRWAVGLGLVSYVVPAAH